MNSRRFLLSLAAAGMLALAGCERAAPPHHFNAIDLTGAEYARRLDLPDFDGKPRTLADFKGKLVVLFFGYTQCPDVCPTTMAELAAVMKELGPAADEVQVLFVTLDPERDTQQLLASYVPAFDKRFVGLYGTPEQTAKVAKDFKVFYRKAAGSTPDNYSMEHSAASYVFDPSGKLRLYVRYGGGAQALADDLKLLLQS